MNQIVIGDIHGRDIWQQIDVASYYKIIFIGDYVDSFEKTDEEIYANLLAIIELKKENPEKVILLWGNHDVQYLHFPKYQCTGYRQSMQIVLSELFRENRNLFQMAYQHENYLFTHAGVTNAWYNEFLRLPILDRIRDDEDTLADLINKIEETGQRYLLYAPGVYRGGEGNGGILWADLRETKQDMLNGVHQVVGHTATEAPVTYGFGDTTITYIDVLATQNYFHVIDHRKTVERKLRR